MIRRNGRAQPGDIEGMRVVLQNTFKGKDILRPRQGEPLPKHDPLAARRRADPDLDLACREFIDGEEDTVSTKVIERRAAEIRREREAAEREEEAFQASVQAQGFAPRRFKNQIMADWPVRESVDDAE